MMHVYACTLLRTILLSFGRKLLLRMHPYMPREVFFVGYCPDEKI